MSGGPSEYRWAIAALGPRRSGTTEYRVADVVDGHAERPATRTTPRRAG